MISASAVHNPALPIDPSESFESARAAFARRDLLEAISLWEQARTRFADMPEGYTGGAQSLRVAGRLEEAEALALEAAERFPKDAGVLIERCRIALTRQDTAAALLHTRQLQSDHPDVPEGISLGITALRRNGSFNEAASLAESGMKQFPKWAPIFIEHAWLAAYRNDWTGAIGRWLRVRELFPAAPEGWYGGASALMRAGKFDAAEELIVDGYKRFPKDLNVLIQWSTSAMRRRAWAEARQRWENAMSVYPGDPTIANGLGELKVLFQLAQLDTGAGVAGEAGAEAASESRSSTIERRSEAPKQRSFYLSFEGLGNNCEFGLVQRLAGLEPLGLLRWASISVERLIAMLDSRFEGVGKPENTKITVGQTGEYELEDTRYFSMHTFIRSGQDDEGKLLDKMCRRLRFLKDKLINDLVSGEKIFVYKTPHGFLKDIRVVELNQAVKNYGDNVLLVVGKPEDAVKDRLVEKIEDGLFVGYISDLTTDPHKVRSYASAWLAVCRQAYLLSRVDVNA